MLKSTPEIFESESNFCLIVWEYEPVTGGALVKLCAERLGWKKSTVYTVIKRLASRGVISSENGVVTSLVSKKEYALSKVRTITEKYFDGDFDALIKAWKNPGESTSKKTEVTTAKNIYGAIPADSESKPAVKRKVSPKTKVKTQESKIHIEEQPEKIEKTVQTKAIPSFLL